MLLCNKNKRAVCGVRIEGEGFAVIAAITFIISGCAGTSSSVIATTGTTIGVEMSANAANQTPTAVLGYRRAEFAYVPTNRSNATKSTTTQEGGITNTTEDGGTPSVGKGASDTGNVLMELRYKGIFSQGTGGGIYQRLAVGDLAVQQPGATFMFARDDAGAINPQVAEYASQAALQISSDREKIAKIVAAVTDQNDVVDASKLNALVDKAAKSDPLRVSTTVVARIKKVKTGTALGALLFDPLDGVVTPLFNAL